MKRRTRFGAAEHVHRHAAAIDSADAARIFEQAARLAKRGLCLDALSNALGASVIAGRFEAHAKSLDRSAAQVHARQKIDDHRAEFMDQIKNCFVKR